MPFQLHVRHTEILRVRITVTDVKTFSFFDAQSTAPVGAATRNFTTIKDALYKSTDHNMQLILQTCLAAGNITCVGQQSFS